MRHTRAASTNPSVVLLGNGASDIGVAAIIVAQSALVMMILNVSMVSGIEKGVGFRKRQGVHDLQVEMRLMKRVLSLGCLVCLISSF